MLNTRSQPITGYTLMVVRAEVNRLYGSSPDGDPLGGFLKDRGSLILDARSHPITGCTMMATRADQPPIWVLTLSATLRGAS